MTLLVKFLLLSSFAITSPSASQTTQSADTTIARSESVGRLLYRFDRAAWVGTDALFASVSKDQVGPSGGYLVEHAEGDMLRVSFYRGGEADGLVFFVADIRDGKVVRGALLTSPVPLTPAQSSLVRARAVAMQTAIASGYRPCISRPFNSVVLPPATNGDPFAVYLLTPQVEESTYPIGGHYRIAVGPDGTVQSSRAFNRSCLTIDLSKIRAGGKAAGMVVSHLLDPVPTELHMFTSYSAGLPLYVSTPDTQLWKVGDGRVSRVDPSR